LPTEPWRKDWFDLLSPEMKRKYKDSDPSKQRDKIGNNALANVTSKRD